MLARRSASIASLAHFLALLLVGCGPLSPERGHLAISPAVVYLSGAPEGEAAAATVALYNVGDAPLEIEAVQLGISTGYTVESPSLPARLAPGEELGLRVQRRAGQGVPRENALEVVSDDPTQPSLRVELHAPAATPLLAATPSSIEFGAVPSGESAEREVVVRNLGLGVARSLGLEWLPGSSADFAASLSGVEILPGAELQLRLSYAPRGGGADQARLRLRSGESSQLLWLSGRQDLAPPD